MPGFTSDVLNPKAALFFLAFLLQFASPGSAIRVGPQMILLGLAYTLLSLAVFCAVAFSSGTLGE